MAWLSVWSKVQTCIWPRCCHCHSLSLASVKSRLVLPFWYRLTWVVPEKGPLNGCVCVCFPKVKDILRLGDLQAVTYTVKVVVSKKWKHLQSFISNVGGRQRSAARSVSEMQHLPPLSGRKPATGRRRCHLSPACPPIRRLLLLLHLFTCSWEDVIDFPLSERDMSNNDH